MSPYKALYGVRPPLLPAYSFEDSKVESVNELLQKRNEIHRELRINLQHAQDRMKKFADLNRKEKEFQVGD